MQDKKLFKVRLGDSVQLQFIPEDDRDRLNARMIGHAPNKSIINSAPSMAGKYPILGEKQHFVVPMMRDNHVYGFESGVLKDDTGPCSHVHLKQPEDLTRINGIQKDPRFNTVIGKLIRPEELPGDGGYRYGVKLVSLDAEHTLILNAYAHEQIVLQLEEKPLEA